MAKSANSSPSKAREMEIRQEIRDRKKELSQYKKETGKGNKEKLKEIKAREKALADTSFGDKIWIFFVTLIIITVWLFILAFVLKFNVWGLGMKAAPFLEQIPYGHYLIP